MPWIAEINGGIYICGERLKTRLSILFCFVSMFCNSSLKVWWLGEKHYDWVFVAILF